MADNGLDGSHPVIGLAFDGTGYGEDGAIWGGEFLVADYAGYQRPIIWPIFLSPAETRRSNGQPAQPWLCSGIGYGLG